MKKLIMVLLLITLYGCVDPKEEACKNNGGFNKTHIDSVVQLQYMHALCNDGNYQMVRK